MSLIDIFDDQAEYNLKISNAFVFLCFHYGLKESLEVLLISFYELLSFSCKDLYSDLLH